MRGLDWLRTFGGRQVAALVVAALAATVVLSSVFWDWLNTGESPSATIRNLGLVIGGIIAGLLAMWRSTVAERQADTAQRQAETAQEGLRNERYQTGAKMLGSVVLSERLGGIYALQRLAHEHPGQYHIQIMRLFCAFVRNPPASEEHEHRKEPEDRLPPRFPALRDDVQAVMEAIGARHEQQFTLERKEAFRFDLHGADLSHAQVSGLNLSGADLTQTDFSEANLSKANLSGAGLAHAKLHCADLGRANLSKAWVAGADLSGAALCGAVLCDVNLYLADLAGAALCDANLSGANLDSTILTDADLNGIDVGAEHEPTSGVTQSQLDEARADENNPPNLDGAVDAETGEPLVWRDRSLPA